MFVGSRLHKASAFRARSYSGTGYSSLLVWWVRVFSVLGRAQSVREFSAGEVRLGCYQSLPFCVLFGWSGLCILTTVNNTSSIAYCKSFGGPCQNLDRHLKKPCLQILLFTSDLNQSLRWLLACASSTLLSLFNRSKRAFWRVAIPGIFRSRIHRALFATSRFNIFILYIPQKTLGKKFLRSIMAHFSEFFQIKGGFLR